MEDLTREDLQKLRSYLTAEAKQEIADQCHITLGSLKNILGGRSKNVAVIEAATNKALELKAKQGMLKKSIASL